MTRLSFFQVSEVALGVYSDETRFSVKPFIGHQPYPLSITYDPTPPPGATSNMCVEFGDQNWGYHYGIIEHISVSDDKLVVKFHGDSAPVPWLETTVTFEWGTIANGKELIFQFFDWICTTCDVAFEKISP